MTIGERAAAIGSDWRSHMDELVLPMAQEFYLLPPGKEGLSDGNGKYQLDSHKPHATVSQWLSKQVHRHFIADGSWGARFFGAHLKTNGKSNSWRHGLWYWLLGPSSLYRQATLGCKNCGDCLQDHLDYAGCSMRWCYKELRNGPCGGSDKGKCEVNPDIPCGWELIYERLKTLGQLDRFERPVVPKDWTTSRDGGPRKIVREDLRI